MRHSRHQCAELPDDVTGAEMIRRLKLSCSSGFALLEAVIAVLLTAVVVAGLFSVILTSFTTDTRSDARQDAGLALKMASDMLRSHVAAKPDDVPILDDADDPCRDKFADPWAAGTHDLDCLVQSSPSKPSQFPKLPDGTHLSYTVTDSLPAKDTGLIFKDVTFTLTLPDEKK